MSKKGTAVLITTKHRGVFFGYLVGVPSPEKVTLTQCRNCVRWDTGMRGFLGLASHGPSDQCKVGFAAPMATLYDITSVVECAPAAVERWEMGLWR